MSITVLLGRRVALFAICGLADSACASKPASITITCQSSCKEGATLPIAAEVKDAKGRRLPIPVAWTVEPAPAGRLEGTTLRCQTEGKFSLRASAGVSTTQEVTVIPPIIGTWTRVGDEYSGMTLRISADTSGNLAGYIVRPPNDSSLAVIKRDRKSSDEMAAAIVACSAHAWGPGLLKWSGIKRLGDNRWSTADLTKEVHIGRTSCEEVVKKAQYVDGYELSLASDDKLELRNLRVNNPPQSWQKGEDIDDAAIAIQKAACETARDVAANAYADVVPGLDEAAKQVSGKFWAGNGSLADFQTTQRLATTLKAAQVGLSQGAYRARQAARAIPNNDSLPNLNTVREASEAMFIACKEVLP